MHYQRRSRGGSFPLGKIFLGIAIPVIVVMGAIRIYNNYEIEIFEPEYLHQRAITKLADKLVVGVAVPEWQDVRLIYTSVEFAEDLQTAYANIAYRYSEGSLEKSVQFPVKLVLILLVNGHGQKGNTDHSIHIRYLANHLIAPVGDSR